MRARAQRCADPVEQRGAEDVGPGEAIPGRLKPARRGLAAAPPFSTRRHEPMLSLVCSGGHPTSAATQCANDHAPAFAGAALAAAGLAATWLSPPTPLPALLGIYLVFGIGLGTINPPISTSAVSGMLLSMARGGRLGRIHQSPGRDYPGGGRVRVGRRRGDGSRRSGLHRSDPYRLVDRGRPRAGDLRAGTDWLQA